MLCRTVCNQLINLTCYCGGQKDNLTPTDSALRWRVRLCPHGSDDFGLLTYLLTWLREPFSVVTNLRTLMSETCASVRTPWRHSRSMSPWDTSNLSTSTDRTLRNAFRNDPWIGTCDNTTITAVTSTSSGCNVITGCYCCWLSHSLDSCNWTTDA